MNQNIVNILKHSNIASVPEIDNASLFLQDKTLESMQEVLLSTSNGLEKAEKSLGELYELVSYTQGDEKAEKYIQKLIKERQKVQELISARSISPAQIASMLKAQKDIAFFADVTYTNKKNPLRIVKLRDIDAETKFSKVGTMLLPKLEDGALKLASANNHYYINYTWVDHKQYQNFFLALEKVMEEDFKVGVSDEEKNVYKQALYELNELLVKASNAVLRKNNAQGMQYLQQADELLSIFVGAKMPRVLKREESIEKPTVDDVEDAVEKNKGCGKEMANYIDHILCLSYDQNPDMQQSGDRNGLIIRSKSPLKGRMIHRKEDGTEDTEEITL